MTRLKRTFSVNKVERAPSSSVLRCLPPMSISSPWIHTGKMIVILLRKRMIHQQVDLLTRTEKIVCVCKCIIFLMYMLQSQCNAGNLHLRKRFTISAHFRANAICWTNTASASFMPADSEVSK